MKTYVETLIDMHQKMRKKWADEDKVRNKAIKDTKKKSFD